MSTALSPSGSGTVPEHRAALATQVDERPMEVGPIQEDLMYAKRASQASREHLDATSRLYDPIREKQWEQKYRFYSDPKMRTKYRTFARAEHDPFNKDPSWGRAVVSNMAHACETAGIPPTNLVSSQQPIGRSDLKQTMRSIMPSVSDLEVDAAFDIMDQDHEGIVSADKFRDVLARGKQTVFPHEAAQRWRNPIHRINRMAPAQVEGWDHLVGQPTRESSLELMNEAQSRELLGRVGNVLSSTPRALRHTILDARPKYQHFGGGADSHRFERLAWTRDRSVPNNWTPREAPRAGAGANSRGAEMRTPRSARL